MRKSDLFHHKTIKKLCEQTDLTSKQKEAMGKWLSYLDAGDLEKEKESYPKFMKTILQDILGFPIEEIGHEEDNVDFSFNNPAGKKVLCVECKGTGTEPDALQHRDKKAHETPIDQTWDYVSNTGSAYGICTNYKEFVLMTRTDYPALHWFDFESLREKPEKLKEFVGIFSKESLIDKGGSVEVLHKESVEEEREFTMEFYKLFHQTRLMMIRAFQEKEGVTKDEAINYAQLYLNRLIFIFFAEDNKLLEKKLFMERVVKSLNSNVSEYSKMISDQILDLFRVMDKGSHMLEIVGFGGGIFQEQIPSKIHFLDLKDKKFFNDITSKIKLKIKPDNTIQSLIDRERKLNPIIKNLLMMDSFDFTTDLNVNILGHIFEQSISDLEELKEEKVSRRKKEGVYYTPEYITDYICRNTIVPYLSKSGANSIHELIVEYNDNIEELEKKFREMKILDPACGSGAFLIKAVDILLEIHKEILRLKIKHDESTGGGKYSDNGQTKMDKWNEESEARKIIENNIYGVDVNPESVAITKLALFLKIAERGKKLIELTSNIKVGNSLISDKSIDKMAFNWELEFPQIFYDENGNKKTNYGFGVVIGNPPYLNVETLNDNFKNALKKFSCYSGKSDLLYYFYNRGITLLKENGILGFITSRYFIEATHASKLRQFILDKCEIKKIIDLSKLAVFKNVGIHTVILTLRKSSSVDSNYFFKDVSKEQDLKNLEFTQLKQADLSSKQWVIGKNDEVKIFKKIDSNPNTVKLGMITEIEQGQKTGYNKAFVVDTEIISDNHLEDFFIRKLVKNSYVHEYFIEDNDKFLIFASNELTPKNAPNIIKYLGKFRVKLESRAEAKDGLYPWYRIQRPRRKELFDVDEKIIVPYRSTKNKFGYDNMQRFNDGGDIRILSDFKTGYNAKYLLGILNSKLMNFYYSYIGRKKGNVYEYFVEPLEKIPIVKPNGKKQKLITLVSQIIKLRNDIFYEKSKDVNKIKILENSIDELVYELYNISKEEKKIIELKLT